VRKRGGMRKLTLVLSFVTLGIWMGWNEQQQD